MVGGTSAGAAIMSRVMISEPPEPRALTGGAMRPFRGLGLWKGVIVDQHFVERDRLARLLTAVLDNPRLVGVGISERTACIVDGEEFCLTGRTAVIQLDEGESAMAYTFRDITKEVAAEQICQVVGSCRRRGGSVLFGLLHLLRFARATRQQRCKYHDKNAFHVGLSIL